MDKLTIRFEHSNYLNDDLNNYLMILRGVTYSKVDTNNNEMYVEYDSEIIPLKLLKMEILLYLDIMNIPSVISFDKHIKNTKEDIIIIKDLCCEYCLKGMIEDLLEIEGIESAYTYFDYNDEIDVKIFITYDDKVIDKNKIKEIENKFNKI